MKFIRAILEFFGLTSYPYRRGYMFAETELKSGTSVAHLEELIDLSQGDSGPDQFDRGAQAAIRDFENGTL